MTTLTFHIGGKIVRTVREWFYVSGKIIEDMHDPDKVSFFTILERCAAFGYKNIGKVWYDEHPDGVGLKENLNSFCGDNSFLPFIRYALHNNVVHIYVEHNDVTHPYFESENPKTLCENLGISDHGVRLGGTSVSNKGKNVIDESDECDEYGGYVSEYCDSDYDGDDNDEVGNDYWVDCPYLSVDEDEEFLLHREKKKKFKSRRQKKRVDVSGPRVEREEGDVGCPRVEREEGDVGGPQVERGEGNLGGNEEFVEEIRREMRRRAHVGVGVQPSEAEVPEDSIDASFDSGSEGSFITSSSGSEAEHAVRIKHTRPRFKQGEQIPQLFVCMVFPNKKVFMKVVISHAIHHKRDVKFIQNDKKRCRAVCNQSDCEWRVLCSIDGRSQQWMVKTYFGQHTCQRQHHISCLNYKILADWFINRLSRLALKLTLVEMRDHFRDQTKISVSKGLCRHAKMKVIEHYIGDPLKEFARLEDYVAELNRSNPGSTVVLEAPDGVFKRMYVCFDGVRKGFNAACRKIIGLDGCFLKGPFRGEILTAIGRDANDQMYPIAWAVVGYEDKETWKWFLELLMVDLDIAGGDYVYASDGAPNIPRGGGFTFISDQQKGLLLAIAELMPSAVHRRCARHIFAKWRKQHCSDDLHRQFWVICKASTPAEFLDELEILKGMSTNAMTDFLEVPPNFWCKAFQDTSPCCDIVDNNLSESFNSLIMESRYKSIVKLFETIRKLVFKRFKERKVSVGKFKDGLGPNIWKKINANMEQSHKYYVDSNGDDGFEVHLDEDTSWIVSLEKSTCTCRMWELNGIPCAHAICVIVNETNTLDVRGFVSKWYTQEMFEMAYMEPIKPVHCMKFWPRIAATQIKPPSFTKFLGRPKKLRRREPWEPAVGGTKMSRKGRKMTCTICRQYGHISNTCPAKASGADMHSGGANIEAAEANVQSAESIVEAAEANEENNIVQRKNCVCSFCKKEGHRKNTCVLNPTSKLFITPNSQVSSSQPATQTSDRTQVLWQELRETCGTSTRRRKTARSKGKLPSGLGCFVVESGWTCYDPNTPRQRVIDVPVRKSKRLASAGAAATSSR